MQACYSLYILKTVKTSSEVSLLRRFLPDTVCQFNSINKNAKLVQEGTHFTPRRAAKQAWGTPLEMGRFDTTVLWSIWGVGKMKSHILYILQNKALSEGNYRCIPDCKALHNRAEGERDDYWNVKRGKKSRWNVVLLKCQAEIIKACHLLFQQEYPSLHMVYHSFLVKWNGKWEPGLPFISKGNTSVS